MLNSKQIDEAFTTEAVIAESLGIKTGVKPEGKTKNLYRGWMLSGEEYLAFATANNLVIDLSEYLYTHYLPHWYRDFKDLTPTSIHTDNDNIYYLYGRAGLIKYPAVIKDWVKSQKDYWDEAMYVPTEEHVPLIAKKFKNLSVTINKGFVLREFVPLIAETRTWWIKGKHVLTSKHPDAFKIDSGLAGAINYILKQRNIVFAAVDIAQTHTGQIVLEVGNGQVSSVHSDSTWELYSLLKDLLIGEI